MDQVEICKEFHRDPTVNPRTGAAIQEGKRVYNELVNMCGHPPGKVPLTASMLAPSVPPMFAPPVPTTTHTIIREGDLILLVLADTNELYEIPRTPEVDELIFNLMSLGRPA